MVSSDNSCEQDDGDAAHAGVDPDPVLDEVLAALADRRRRALLARLRGAEGEPVDVEELVGAIASVHAAGERGGREQAMVELYHAHLPKLEEAGIVEFDPRTGVVRYEGHDAAEAVLNVVAARER